MNREHQEALDGLSPRIRDAVQELQGVISTRFPGTTFRVSRGHDDPENIHLNAIVDLEDPEQVLDLVDERLDQLQVEQSIPVYVIPLRTPERVLAAMQAQRATQRGRQARTVPLVGRSI